KDGADRGSKNEEQNEKAKQESSCIYALKEISVEVQDEDTTEFVKDDGKKTLTISVGLLDEEVTLEFESMKHDEDM
ncbi:hypothetical protein S83_014756, partial [Arachis hypogaea]